MSDFLIDTIEHSWGKSPKQKAREKEYNAEYYRKHKEKWDRTAEDIRNNPSMGAGENKRIDPKKFSNFGTDYASSTMNLKDANKYYLNGVTQARKSPDGMHEGRTLGYWQNQYNFTKQQLDAIAEYNKDTAKKRSQTGQSENERSKAYNQAIQNRDRHLDKEQEREIYENSFKGKAEKKVKEVVQTAKNTINEGMDFVKNLFK